LLATSTVEVFDNLASGSYYAGAIALPSEGELILDNNVIGRSVEVSGVSCTGLSR